MNDGQSEEVVGGKWSNEEGRLSKDIIESGGMGGEGAEVDDRGWGGETREESMPEELRVVG